MGVLVLYDTCGIGGDAFTLTAIPAHQHLVEFAVVQVVGFHLQLPDAVGFGLEGIFLQLFPFREIADEGYRGGIWCPFAEYPSAVGGAVQSEIVMGIGKGVERAVRAAQFGLLAQYVFMASGYSLGIRFKPGVILEDVESLFFHYVWGDYNRPNCVSPTNLRNSPSTSKKTIEKNVKT